MSARHNRTPLHRLTTRHTLNALQQQRGYWLCALTYSATRYWPSNATALRIEVVGLSAGAPTAQRLSTIFSTQDGLSRQYYILLWTIVQPLGGGRSPCPPLRTSLLCCRERYWPCCLQLFPPGQDHLLYVTPGAESRFPLNCYKYNRCLSATAV